jgi:hypothetical protein
MNYAANEETLFFHKQTGWKFGRKGFVEISPKRR